MGLDVLDSDKLTTHSTEIEPRRMETIDNDSEYIIEVTPR